jgi:hypothetical protein
LRHSTICRCGITERSQQRLGLRGVTVGRMAELRQLLKELPGLDGPTLVEAVVPKHDLAPQLARLAGAPAETLKYQRKERPKVSVV